MASKRVLIIAFVGLLFLMIIYWQFKIKKTPTTKHEIEPDNYIDMNDDLQDKYDLYGEIKEFMDKQTNYVMNN